MILLMCNIDDPIVLHCTSASNLVFLSQNHNIELLNILYLWCHFDSCKLEYAYNLVNYLFQMLGGPCLRMTISLFTFEYHNNAISPYN